MEKKNRPNFLIFMTDQQLGSTQSNAEVYTPNLDRLKENGVTFDRAYCAHPHCCPSRAGFFSGLYASEHGVWNNIDLAGAFSHGLYDGVRLFTQDLQDAGYQMYFSGKWHVSREEGPTEAGFDHVFLRRPMKFEKWKNRPYMEEWSWFEEGKYTVYPTADREEGEIIRPGYPKLRLYGNHENPFGDRTVTEQARDWILNMETDTPFCLYAGTLGPHDPYIVPQRFLDMYKDKKVTLPASWEDDLTDKPNLYRRTQDRFRQLSREEQENALRHYYAFCTYEDELFGMLLDALEKRKLLENTIVLYVSDHGDYAGAHGLWTKGLPCFEEAYHICSVMGFGGLEKRTVKEKISLLDYAPTFLELAGIRVERQMSGWSLVPYLQGEKPEKVREEIYTQSNGNESYGIQRSIFTDQYHFVFNDFDYDELYDLAKDPDCMKNVADEPEYEDVVREMYQKLWKFMYEHKDIMGDDYVTTALAQYGPGIIGMKEKEREESV